MPLAAIEAIGADVVAAVGVKRAVWTHWNLMAEASKQTMDLRFATTEDREAVVGHGRRRGAVAVGVADSAGARDSARSGSSARTARAVFRPRHGEKYSSTAVLDAEARLLARAEKRDRADGAPRALRRGRLRLERSS